MRRPVRIGNSSGFYGDRRAAVREMVEGGPIDILTGDYLAELTMLILWKARQKDPGAGYARTILGQLEEVLGTCLDRGVKIVNNAGGLNPAGLAAEIGALGERLGLHPRIAYVTGDDLMPRIEDLNIGGPAPITANAYLGGWGIAAALEAGADIVVCPRVTDASLVVGPAAWWHGWARDDFDALAGAVLAGHVIECGPQATGGNYPFLDEIVDRRHPGFPIAEVAADGSSVITKHPGTGGLVSVGTVTAQLLYEIAQPAYANPDVVAHFDTARLEQVGPDRVGISGTIGTPPPPTAKVAVNALGGYRNTMTLVLTGLDIEQKARWALDELDDVLRDVTTDVCMQRFDPTEQAAAHLRITVRDPDPAKVGRRFTNAIIELALSNYAGLHTTTPPTAETAYGIYTPIEVPAGMVAHAVVLPDGIRVDIPPTPTGPGGVMSSHRRQAFVGSGDTVRIPLGRICGARSGDKGGDANVGFWVRERKAYPWMVNFLTADRLVELLPEAAGLAVRRWELPNLAAINFVITGLLGAGVAASTRPDPQAKGLGEYLRSRLVDVPVELAPTPSDGESSPWPSCRTP